MSDKEIGSTTPQEQPDDKPNAVAAFFGFDNLKSLAILILAIFAFRWTVMSPYHVPTASMEPTIKVGDRLLANKLSYNLKLPFTEVVLAEWSKPQRGDIVVFRYPRDPDVDYVKRVVAVEGDEVQLLDDILYINGVAQARTDHNQDRSILNDIEDNAEIKRLYLEDLSGVSHWVMQNELAERRFQRGNWPSDGKSVVKVPANSVFVIGDNRDNSNDSRVWGEVPVQYIRGRATYVIWSIYSPRDSSAWPSLRWNRFGYHLQ